MAQKIKVEREMCDGYGNCVFVAPEVFDLDDANVVTLITDSVGPELEEKVRLAVDECPTRAIAVEEE